MANRNYTFTSESVTEGHPAKVCNCIADSILDAYLEEDRGSHVACEVLCKDNHVILAGEIKANAQIEIEAVVRRVIREIGYTDAATAFNSDSVVITNLLGRQAQEIDQGVSGAKEQGMQGIFSEAAGMLHLPGEPRSR